MEQLLHQQYASTRISDLIVEPSNPPDNIQTSELLLKSLAFVKLYRQPNPFFRTPQYQEAWDQVGLDA